MVESYIRYKKSVVRRHIPTPESQYVYYTEVWPIIIYVTNMQWSARWLRLSALKNFNNLKKAYILSIGAYTTNTTTRRNET